MVVGTVGQRTIAVGGPAVAVVAVATFPATEVAAVADVDTPPVLAGPSCRGRPTLVPSRHVPVARPFPAVGVATIADTPRLDDAPASKEAPGPQTPGAVAGT